MRWYVLLLVAGLLLRLGLALLATHPGLFDPNHYYNLARNLVDGRGFVIDYIWQYHQPPADVTHPIDYWMPLAAVWPAISMRVLGGSLLAALLPNILFSTALAALTGLIARMARLSHNAKLMSMALILFLPDYVLGAVRTHDRLLRPVLWSGPCVSVPGDEWSSMAAGAGWRCRRSGATDTAGRAALPALLAGAVLLWRCGGRSMPWRWLFALLLTWTLVLAPWIWRNQQDWGSCGPPAGNHALLTSLLTAAKSTLTIIWPGAGRTSSITSALANLKVMVTTQGFALPLLALIGLGGWLRSRRERLWQLLTPLLFLLVLYGVYTILLPFHSMGGSFKKSWLALIPFLAVAGAWALDAYMRPRLVGRIAPRWSGFMLMPIATWWRIRRRWKRLRGDG